MTENKAKLNSSPLVGYAGPTLANKEMSWQVKSYLKKSEKMMCSGHATVKKAVWELFLSYSLRRLSHCEIHVKIELH